MQRWALKRYIRPVTFKDYIKALNAFIADFEAQYGCKATVQLKLYRAPQWRPTRIIDDYEPEDNFYKNLPATKVMTKKDWAEAKVVECIVTPSQPSKKYDAVFASVQAKGYFGRQITFYAQGIGADEICRSLAYNSTRGSRLATGSFDESFRCHHSRGHF